MTAKPPFVTLERRLDPTRCAECGMPEKYWLKSENVGFYKNENLYCCVGCALATGCTCSEKSG